MSGDPRSSGARSSNEMIALLTSLEEQLGEDLALCPYRPHHQCVLGHGHRAPAEGLRGSAIAGQERLRKRSRFLALATRTRHHRPTHGSCRTPAWTQSWRLVHRSGRNSNGSVAAGRRSGRKPRVRSGNFAHVNRDLEPRFARELGLEAARLSRSYCVTAMRSSARMLAVFAAASPRKKSPSKLRWAAAHGDPEAQEPSRGAERLGAMPHKRNPELASRICGLRAWSRTNALDGPRKRPLWPRAGNQPFPRS